MKVTDQPATNHILNMKHIEWTYENGILSIEVLLMIFDFWCNITNEFDAIGTKVPFASEAKISFASETKIFFPQK